MVSLGGGDIHEMVQVVARGIYPRCEEDLHKDPEEGFKLVLLTPIRYISGISRSVISGKKIQNLLFSP